mmetsp:Transcript_11442/g.11454  ORF Transcript_11442/g.11454 Transcript_11442/m.11454 type:complete len:83 (+) Transcript_11442:1-249(+)
MKSKVLTGWVWILGLVWLVQGAPSLSPEQLEEMDMNFEQYTYLTYDLMRGKLNQLEKLYPRLMKIDSSKTLLGLSHFVDCGS